MNSRTGAIARSRTTNQVLDSLRIDILTNVYLDGEQVTETMLADRYGTNRASVRNTLMVLEREGLIRVADNGTKKVCRFTQEDANNLYDLRRYIELNAARQFFSQPQRVYDHLLEAMKNAYIKMRLGIVRDILQADADFHCAIIQLSRNKAFLQTWIALSSTTQTLFLLNVNDSDQYRQRYMQTFPQQHEALLAAFMTDEEKYLGLIAHHIEESRELSCDVMNRISQGRLKIQKYDK
jgi:DNA-binding GntR family transcriptional regulator